MAGMKAMNERITQERRNADFDSLIRRMSRLFMRGNKHDKKEEEVRRIWIAWGARAVAAGVVPRAS
jgi:hypothetical protein